MTACAYICPDDWPALISDVLASPEGYEGSFLLPSNIAHLRRRGNLPIATLVRKNFILNDRTAVAMAGDARNIINFIEDKRPIMDAIASGGRPMQILSTSANDTSSIEVVGASIIGNDYESRDINYMTPSGITVLPILGYMSCIGSGGRELSRRLHNIETQLNKSFDPSIKAIDVARGVSSFICANKIEQEMFGNINDSWGGFVECIHFDYSKMKWVRPPGNLYLIIEVSRIGHHKMTLGLVHKAFAYDPGTNHGRILAIHGNSTGTELYDWVIKDFSNEDDYVITQPTQEFWSNWYPQTATMLVVEVDNKRLTGRSFIKSTSPMERQYVNFHFNEGKVQCGLAPILVDQISKQVSESWQLECVRGPA